MKKIAYYSLLFTLCSPILVSAQTTITNNPVIEIETTAPGSSTICVWGDITTGGSEQSAHCTPYQNNLTLSLTPSTGEKTIFVQHKNGSGEIISTLSDTLFLDITPPENPDFSFPASTQNKYMSLSVNPVNEDILVYISGDLISTETTFNWVPYQTTYGVILTDGYGEKNISVQYKDTIENRSAQITKKTTLVEPSTEETTAPITPIKPTPKKAIYKPIYTNHNAAPTIEEIPLNENTNSTISSVDTDGDGLTDEEEIGIYHTDALNTDTDYDLLEDGDEILIHKTNPLLFDTDGDGCSDGAEIAQQTNPLDPKDSACLEMKETETIDTTQTIGIRDSDNDGLSDAIEQKLGTNPLIQDSDTDGFSDGDETLLYGTNPLSNKKNPSTITRLHISNWKNKDVMTGTDWIINGACPTSSTIQLFLSDANGENISLGETSCTDNNIFTFQTTKAVRDGYYTLFAKTPTNTFTSSSLSITVDKTTPISVPEVDAIDSIVVEKPYIEARVIIVNQQPVVYGKTIYGNTIQATFESIITSSSVIADSTLGEFAIQPPRKLDIGKHHVTLYAIDNSGKRSSSISLPFTIEEEKNKTATQQTNEQAPLTETAYWMYITIGSVLCIIIIGSVILVKIKRKKIKESLLSATETSPETTPSENAETINDSSIHLRKL